MIDKHNDLPQEVVCSICNKPRLLTRVMRWRIDTERSNNVCITCFNKSPEKREQLKKTMKGKNLNENNGQWKGNEVGYGALHSWIKRNQIVPKPKLCKCKKNKPFDLANKGIYDRNPKNWEWLCRKCHMESDGRTAKLKGRKCGICGKFREAGIRYLHGEKTCERCWNKRQRSKNKFTSNMDKFYEKWRTT